MRQENPYSPSQTTIARFRGFKPPPDIEPSADKALFFLILAILGCWLLTQ